MQQVNSSNFGLLIAYLLPGFAVLWGIALFSETVRTWLGTAPSQAPTVGGFLYVTLASVGAGMAASTVRWLIIDSIHQATGIREPRWNFSTLAERVAAFQSLIEYQYRYYQFYGNTLVALVFVYAAHRMTVGSVAELGWIDVGFAVLAVAFFAGSRDTLRKYYQRSADLLGDGARLKEGKRIDS